MEARLVVEKGKTQKRAFQLQSSETIIGRRQDCDLRIVSSAVSRRHCVVSISDDYLMVEDLDSVNGTFVNGARVAGKQVLRPGDRLEVGPLRFVVDYKLSREALHRLEQTAEASPVEEEVEELALAEPDDMGEELTVAEIDEEVDELPLADEETELVSEGASGAHLEAQPVNEDDEPIPVIEDFEDLTWQPPKSGDLRDILSQMDPNQPKKAEDK